MSGTFSGARWSGRARPGEALYAGSPRNGDGSASPAAPPRSVVPRSTRPAGMAGEAAAAGWNMTKGVRVELAGQEIRVQDVHLAAADTDMMADVTHPG